MCYDKVNMPDHSGLNTNRVADKRASTVLTNKVGNEFSDVFPGIGCFEGTFTL